jgi:hypothetical protein
LVAVLVVAGFSMLRTGNLALFGVFEAAAAAAYGAFRVAIARMTRLSAA